MEVNQVTNVQTGEDLAAQQAADRIADNDNTVDQEMFLTLMITQLQHQDPLNPMKNDEFINQLALLTQVEQLQQANTNLDELELGQQAINNSTMVNLVGQEVKALHDGFTYEGQGDHKLTFETASASSTATLTVYDEEGKLIHSKTMSNLEAGMQSYTWRGQTDEGIRADEGQYSFKVTAVDKEGESVAVNHYLIGEIDELDYSAGYAVPIVDEQVLSFTQIVSLVDPEEETTATSGLGDDTSDSDDEESGTAEKYNNNPSAFAADAYGPQF